MTEGTPNTLAIASSFKTLVQGLFQISNQVDHNLAIFRQDAAIIRDYYEPRAEFERWRDSADGKAWKKRQHQRQDRCCAICQGSIPCRGSHIDHIKSISQYPELNLDTNNMQVTCPICNTSKGNQC
ncbi:MAG: HNH endonuclease [Acaryochloris sp. RU_4_1]|nr:HNH endonuclease [Acaryochloris sp. RU_4_1]NJR57063.1 HNH endonuclease [Acaryochloris sp. CRU_2_0]